MQTPLDLAHAAMTAAPDDVTARSAYYSQFATTEIFVLLAGEAGETFEAQMIEMDGRRYALAFDTEERMAAFCDAPTPYLSLSGRTLVQALSGQTVGVGLNLGVAETSMLIPVEALEWISERIGPEVKIDTGRIAELSPPDLDDIKVLRALDARLAAFSGPDRSAYLVHALYETERVHLIVLEGVPEPERTAVAGALTEAVRFLNPDLAIDTLFADREDAVLMAARKAGLRFDMTSQSSRETAQTAPGSDPNKPPILH